MSETISDDKITNENLKNEIVLKNSSKPEVICEAKNYLLIKLDLLESYNDYFECIVFDKNHKVIFLEILGSRSNSPNISVQNNEVNIHFGAGTGTYLDKFIDFEHNRKSNWIDNVRAFGKEHVAYVGYKKKSNDSYENTLIIAKKYKVNNFNRAEYTFLYTLLCFL